jgi:hypothetical protein
VTRGQANAAATRPLFPLGRMYALVVALYVAYPAIAYLALGGDYQPTNDNRLWAIQPSASTVLMITGYGVAHLVAFVAAYALLRGRRGVLPPQAAPRSIGAGIVVAYGALTVFFLVLGCFYDLTASDYLDSYLVPTRLPLLLAQLFVHLTGVRLTLKLVLLLWLFVDYRRYRWPLWIWLVAESLATVLRMGSRTEMVLLVMAALMLYHAYVRRIHPAMVVAAGLAGLLVFTVLGTLRAGVRFENANLFVYNSECDSIFANAVDIEEHILAGEVEPLPAAFYLQDLLALVPQQLLPIPKMDASRWYVETFHRAFADQGGAMAFGTIPQSLLGGRLLEVILRGIALGVLFAGAHRLAARHSASFWPALCYLWLVVFCYQSFRATTFSLLVLFEYRIVPVFLLVTLTSALLRILRPSRARPILSPEGLPA